ncbi:MAG: cysteine synthase A [Oscillospiraceae bacterium]|nr:cysteine synthase A [Candidatus Ruminococcus equi]
MKIFDNVESTIGNTPLVRFSNINKPQDTELLCKLECFNPAKSTKDRAALFMLNVAEQSGELKKGATIIEPTSGNTGIGLASIAIPRGYKLILTMPESMSKERRILLKAYGAQIVLTPASEGMDGAVKKAEQLHSEIENSVILGQFTNPANALAHYETTAREIFSNCDGKLDAFVATIGTGGTITGVAKYLKEQNSDIKIIGVEPKSSPLLSKGVAGPHKIQGIGANFVPDILDMSLIDEIITVSDEDAYKMTREITKEGILVGISSGACLKGAIEYAEKSKKPQRIVALLTDTGERYLSTEGLFD